MTAGPRARDERLIIREFGDELLIYDLDTHHAHSVNRTAAAVLQRCDGTASPEAIARDMSNELDVPIDVHFVWYALHQLAQKRLLVENCFPDGVSPISRRQLIQRIGILAAAIGIPAVTSIVAPTAAQASSCLSTGTTCQVGSQCCSGTCNSGSCT